MKKLLGIIVLAGSLIFLHCLINSTKEGIEKINNTQNTQMELILGEIDK